VLEEVLNFVEMLDVIAKELRRVRQLVRKESATVHERLDDLPEKK
jgi:hypothetical protein